MGLLPVGWDEKFRKVLTRGLDPMTDSLGIGFDEPESVDVSAAMPRRNITGGRGDRFLVMVKHAGAQPAS